MKTGPQIIGPFVELRRAIETDGGSNLLVINWTAFGIFSEATPDDRHRVTTYRQLGYLPPCQRSSVPQVALAAAINIVDRFGWSGVWLTQGRRRPERRQMTAAGIKLSPTPVPSTR